MYIFKMSNYMHILYFIHCSIRILSLESFRILTVEKGTVWQLFLNINKINHLNKFIMFSWRISFKWCYFALLIYIYIYIYMRHWNAIKSSERDISPHALTSNRPSVKHKLLCCFLSIFVGINMESRKSKLF